MRSAGIRGKIKTSGPVGYGRQTLIARDVFSESALRTGRFEPWHHHPGPGWKVPSTLAVTIACGPMARDKSLKNSSG